MKPTIKTIKTNTALCGLISVLLSCGSAPAQAAGPVSKYYLTGQTDRLVGVQGGSIVLDTAMSPLGQYQFAIAVGSTVRTIGYFSGATGGEYTVAGVPTGTTYAYPGVPDILFDGTTDGTFNYAWNFNTGAAYQFSTTWTSPTVLFTLGTGDGNRLGITYDASNNSLWLSGWGGATGATIENYTLGGVLLSSFTVGHDDNAALALDPADGTLWLSNRNTLGTSLTLEQYTKTGTPLASLVLTGVEKNYNVLGGEFQIVVPEPTSAMLLLGSGAMLLLRRRRASV